MFKNKYKKIVNFTWQKHKLLVKCWNVKRGEKMSDKVYLTNEGFLEIEEELNNAEQEYQD